jgi:hypothetical protein
VLGYQLGFANVEDLRSGKLHLSQPAEAGWHFYADDAIRKLLKSLSIGMGKCICGKGCKPKSNRAI